MAGSHSRYNFINFKHACNWGNEERTHMGESGRDGA